MSIDEIRTELDKFESYDLWRIWCMIDVMLHEPARVELSRGRLRIGQEIIYFDTQKNKDLRAVVVELRRSNALVKVLEEERLVVLPFFMIQDDGRIGECSFKSQKVDRLTLKVGDQVGYVSRLNERVYGVVAKLNPKTAEVVLESGEKWRIDYELLFYVTDGEYRDGEVKQIIVMQPSVNGNDYT